MVIKSLSNTSLQHLLDAFNSSFKDYFVELQLSKEELEEKIIAENIQLNYSVGSFDSDKLVGFILVAVENINGIAIAYNAGTGVLPAYRGNRLTLSMYKYLNKTLLPGRVSTHQLEVINSNEYAIKAYDAVGFKVKRILACLKGSPAKYEVNGVTFMETTVQDCEIFIPFWGSRPSWQNTITAIKRTSRAHQSIGAYKNNLLIGYAIVHRKSSRLKQIFVHPDYRALGVGKALLFEIAQQNSASEISIIGVDEAKQEIVDFFVSNGLKIYLRQYEMEMPCDGV